MKNDRRSFFRQMGGATAAAVTTAALVDKLAPAAAAQTSIATAGLSDARAFGAGKYALDLGEASAGWLSSAEGGHATADVVVEALGADHLHRKHLAGVKYEDIIIHAGYGLSNPFYDWLKASFDHQYARKNGAIKSCDFNNRVVSELNFYNALITEIGFPALDAASKDAAKLTIKFAPEYTRFMKGSGQKAVVLPAVQKKWLASNFRLKIDGLEQPAARVNKIEALVLKQKVVEPPVGDDRDYEREGIDVETPNLVITFPESHSDGFYDWHEDFVIKGNNGQENEKGGTLEYLTPDLQEVLFTLTFSNLGIFKCTPEKVESHSDNIRRVKAEMYCEDIHFNYKAAWV